MRNIILVLSCVLLGLSSWAKSIQLLSFENKNELSNWQAATALRISSQQSYHQGKALEWNWQKGEKLSWQGKIDFLPQDENKHDKALSTFSLWVYNEKPVNDYLRISFAKNGSEKCFFNFKLNFSGWRTCWVSYERDMQGHAVKGMDSITFRAPLSRAQGRLFIDQLIPSSQIDPRHQMADHQVPFVNPQVINRANKHWMALEYFSTQKNLSNIKKDTDYAVHDRMNIITQRYEQMIDKTVKVNDAEMARLRSKFRAYGFNGPAGNSQGTPVLFIEHVFIYNFEEHKSQSIKKFADVRYYTRDMLSIARAYRSCKKSSWAVELKNIFIDMYKNMHHYGWASGSGLGTLHHLGYSFRDYYGALFLMREALQQAGLRQQAQQDMYWYSGCGKIYEPFEKSGYANIDILNTTALGQLASVLMIENERERKSQLYAYQHWLNLGLAVAPGLKAPLKVDGSLYHHYNHYTLYGRDALNGITPVIYLLSGGPFRLAEKNHRALNKSLYMMRNYSNRIHYSLAASGRHPSGKNTLSQTPYYWMAKAGTADGKSAIDKKMASMFMRLGQSNLKKYASRIKEFSSRGIQIEEAPTGNWSMNYACQGIHRRDNWLFTVKGFSRYLWGSEIYQGANHYGRYLSYGHTQVLDENGRSGFSEAGWDWNRLPGTTTTVLPFEKLRADIQQVDEQSGREELLLSDEAFAGSLSFKGNGIFAMKLHSHPKYTGELRALKSYFMFDNMVLSLGSGISSTDKIHSTQTTLLQTSIKNEKVAFFLQNKLRDDFPLNEERRSPKPLLLLDPNKNGWFIPSGQKLHISKKIQQSPYAKTDKPGQGLFLKAWLDHGYGPESESYEYAQLIDSSTSQLNEFAHRQQKGEGYKVLQKDEFAHIVKYDGTYAFAIANTKSEFNYNILRSVNFPCLLMMNVQGYTVKMSICDPDLRLYEGRDHEQYDQAGRQREVSIYSRPWAQNESAPSRLMVRLKGKWSVKKNPAVKAKINASQTVLIITCQHGLAVDLELKKL